MKDNKISFCGFVDEREIKQGEDYVRVFRTAEIATKTIPGVETLQRVRVKHLGYRWIPKGEAAAKKFHTVAMKHFKKERIHQSYEGEWR